MYIVVPRNNIFGFLAFWLFGFLAFGLFWLFWLFGFLGFFVRGSMTNNKVL
jgi:hypothetical protein